jgi:hypothetical protein
MAKLSEIASTLKWNSDNKHTLIKVIRGLLNKNLMDTVESDFQRLKKGGNEHYIKEFYEAIVELNNSKPISGNEILYFAEIKKAMSPSKNQYKDSLTGEIILKNFEILQKNSLLAEYLSDFDTYFRGELVAIHRVPHSDIIIFDTKQKPFSNEKQYHWDEPDEKKFYSSKNISYVWNTYNECLISSLFPNYHDAVIGLLGLENNK